MFRRSSLAALVLGVVLLWTTPQDKDRYLRVSFWGYMEGAKDTLWLGVMDSVLSGAPDSMHVNVGCVPYNAPQTWTFGMHVGDYAGNWSGPSNAVTSILLP